MSTNENDPFQTEIQRPEAKAASSQLMPGTIGRYKLLQKIAEGGMGAVYMAEQRDPVTRRVALKLIKSGSDSKQVIARFEAERQALAMMDHPNIARIFDAGATPEGLPFFVMELVKGIPLTEYCDRHQLSVEERIKLFVPVCRAVQHAHTKGIIHRDLKPSNVLVARYDTVPIAKVIDFGLAKATNNQSMLTDKTMYTKFGQVVGTLQYMSPEQAEMNQLDVDTRTDIYSLGVMLYELLTGSPPLDRTRLSDKALLKILEIIRDEEPPKPSTRLSESSVSIAELSEQRRISPTQLRKVLRSDLDWIVMKSLEKDRDRRYSNASDFADELTLYLNGEESTVRPPSFGYRLRKTARKHRKSLAAISMAFVLLASGLVGTGVMWLRALAESQRANQEADEKDLARKDELRARLQVEDQRDQVSLALDRAVKAQDEANIAFAKSSVLLAQARWSSNRTTEAMHVLNSVPQSHRNIEWHLTKSQFDADGVHCVGHTSGVVDVDISPDGTRVASCGNDKTIRIFDIENGEQLGVISEHHDVVTAVSFIDGNQLVSASKDGSIRIWDASTLRQTKVLYDSSMGYDESNLAFVDMDVSGNLKTVAALAADGSIFAWSDFSGKPLVRTKKTEASQIRISPDGNRIFAISRSGRFDLPGSLSSLEAGRDDDFFLGEPGLLVFDLVDSSFELLKWEQEDFQPKTLDISPSGDFVAIGGSHVSEFGNNRKTSLIITGNIETGKMIERKAFSNNSSEVTSIRFTPDGFDLIVGNADGTTEMLNPSRNSFEGVLSRQDGRVNDLAIAPEGLTFVGCSDSNTIKISGINLVAGVVPVWQGTVGNCTLSLVNNQLAFSALDDSLLLNLEDYSLKTFDVDLSGVASWNRLSPSGKHLASWSNGVHVNETGLLNWLSHIKRNGAQKSELVLVNTTSDKVTKLKFKCRISDARFSPDEKRVLVGDVNGRISLWNVADKELLFSTPATDTPISCVAFSNSNDVVAAGSADNAILLAHNLDDTPSRLEGHAGRITSLCFGKEPKDLISADDVGNIFLWDTVSRLPVKKLIGHNGAVTSVAVTKDGTRVISSGIDRTIRVWELATAAELLTIPCKYPAFDVHVSEQGDGIIWREALEYYVSVDLGFLGDSGFEIGIVQSLNFNGSIDKLKTGQDPMLVSHDFLQHYDFWMYHKEQHRQDSFLLAFHYAWMIEMIRGDSKKAKLFQTWQRDDAKNILFEDIFPSRSSSLLSSEYDDLCAEFRKAVEDLNQKDNVVLPPIVERAMELIDETK
ncbi:protein kinase domain-containing protein [Novipirellula sp. SH528]|uniref:protein kinase domain-containing protein n=1 Tax=Novipirellula sp. SH528 TaxID=3454466 RepID=UPI003FA0816D